MVDSTTQILETYRAWLNAQPISSHTRRAYANRTAQFLTFLVDQTTSYGDPLTSTTARDFAVRDFKTFLKVEKQLKPSSVNLSLAALDYFYRSLGQAPPNCPREEIAKTAPQALTQMEQRHLLRTLQSDSAKLDNALINLLLYTGIRIGEAVALNLNDVSLSPRKAQIIIRTGKGNTYREVPLNTAIKTALSAWLEQRSQKFPKTKQIAFFLNRQGLPLSARALDLRLRKIAKNTGLTFSAHTLRHTCLTNLVRNGNDLVLVAEIAGHKRLETTRRYSLPTLADKMQALENLVGEE
jgi:site-specific recombinase XerD